MNVSIGGFQYGFLKIKTNTYFGVYKYSTYDRNPSLQNVAPGSKQTNSDPHHRIIILRKRTNRLQVRFIYHPIDRSQSMEI